VAVAPDPGQWAGPNGCSYYFAMSSFIKYVTFDCADAGPLSAFWSEVTGYQQVTVRDDFAALAAPDGRGIRGILFQKVPEPKSTKSRIHVDLASRDPEHEIERLVGLGARPVARHEGNGTSWTVMLDPEGNEFCIG
jgi:predicted enzyme related to lactoylglutathione lyase